MNAVGSMKEETAGGNMIKELAQRLNTIKRLVYTS